MKKSLRQHLEKIRALKRKVSHPILHKIHKTHKISRKTLFYIKEYGPHSNALKTILKEGIGILIFASLISSFGGIFLESIKSTFISIVPLIILLPILNNLLGDYGIIISSRLSTLLHENKIKKKVFKDRNLQILFIQVLLTALIIVILGVMVVLLVSILLDYTLTIGLILKLFLIILIDVLIIVTSLFLISIWAGLYFLKKREDPNNFLIPITTSIADFVNMFILFILVIIFF